eukprot:169897-Hanusia_phi.AAC.1
MEGEAALWLAGTRVERHARSLTRRSERRREGIEEDEKRRTRSYGSDDGSSAMKEGASSSAASLIHPVRRDELSSPGKRKESFTFHVMNMWSEGGELPHIGDPAVQSPAANMRASKSRLSRTQPMPALKGLTSVEISYPGEATSDDMLLAQNSLKGRKFMSASSKQRLYSLGVNSGSYAVVYPEFSWSPHSFLHKAAQQGEQKN